ncbi:MAG: hypothetical protein M1832_006401 [Thelocarpon impressellum]|nr:MAG: hypothetical protein M1832_006401 [Thelocarpon impressellum]
MSSSSSASSAASSSASAPATPAPSPPGSPPPSPAGTALPWSSAPVTPASLPPGTPTLSPLCTAASLPWPTPAEASIAVFTPQQRHPVRLVDAHVAVYEPDLGSPDAPPPSPPPPYSSFLPPPYSSSGASPLHSLLAALVGGLTGTGCGSLEVVRRACRCGARGCSRRHTRLLVVVGLRGPAPVEARVEAHRRVARVLRERGLAGRGFGVEVWAEGFW